MQYRVINKKTISGYASGVLMIMTTTVIADTGIYQQSPQYLPPLAINHYSPDHYDIRRAESGPLNPWQLPQKPENTPGFDHLPKYQVSHIRNSNRQGNTRTGVIRWGVLLRQKSLNHLNNSRCEPRQCLVAHKKISIYHASPCRISRHQAVMVMVLHLTV